MKRLFSFFRRKKFDKIDLFAPMSKDEADRLHQDFAAFSAASEASAKAEGAILKALIEQVAAEIGRAPIAFNDEGEVFVHSRLQLLLNKPGNEGLGEMMRMMGSIGRRKPS